jgi:hypothetical protein
MKLNPQLKKLMWLLCITAILVIKSTNTFSQTNIWEATLGSSGEDLGKSIVTDAAGNVLIAGTFSGTVDFDPGPGTANLTSLGGSDIFILKLDASRNYLWAIKVGNASTTPQGEDVTAIKTDPAGNVYLTGKFSGEVDFDPIATNPNSKKTSFGVYDGFLTKYTSNGNYQWTNTWSSGSSSIALVNDLAVNTTGDSFVVVYAYDYFGPAISYYGPTTFIHKLNTNGVIQWTKTFPYTYINYVVARSGSLGSIALDNAGNVLVAGSFTGTVNFGGGNRTSNNLNQSDIFITSISPTGNYLWDVTFAGAGDDNATSIVCDASNNIIITGNIANSVDLDPGIGTSLTGQGMFVAKYNSIGIFLSRFNLIGNVYPKKMALDGAGNIFITGYFYGSIDFDPGIANVPRSTITAGTNLFVARYSNSGIYDWAISQGNNNHYNFGNGIAIDPSSSHVVFTGSMQTTVNGINSDNTFIAKYNGRANQTINFNLPLYRHLGEDPIILSATTSAGLPITYLSSNPGVATVSGNVVTIVGIGSTIMTASQPGNPSYYAISIAQEFNVYDGQSNQTIVFDAFPETTIEPDYDPGSFSLYSSTSSGLPVTYSSSNTNVATITGSTVNLVGLGTTTIMAYQIGDSNFHPAIPVSRQLVVKGGQRIIFSPVAPTSCENDSPLVVNAYSTSGLPLSVQFEYSVPSGATFDYLGNNQYRLKFNGPADYSFRFSSGGDDNYNPVFSSWISHVMNPIPKISITTLAPNLELLCEDDLQANGVILSAVGEACWMQWKKNGENIGDVTTNGNLYTSTAGSYSLSASNGCSVESNSIIITTVDCSDFSISPNPANTEVTIQIPAKYRQTLSLSVLNPTLYQTVFTDNYYDSDTSITIDTSYWPEGLFVVQIFFAGGMIAKTLSISHH